MPRVLAGALILPCTLRRFDTLCVWNSANPVVLQCFGALTKLLAF